MRLNGSSDRFWGRRDGHLETRENIQGETERVILVGVQTGRGEDTFASLLELEELAVTAGASVSAKVVQNLSAVYPGTYIGSGKIQEIREMAGALSATGIICDDELSPVQQRNLESELDLKVMDRTLLILDIFAGRANTSEGKIQVELAQLKYRQARLIGMRASLSRLGGGIGTRGPGEKKLEVDRRLINKRIAVLNRELAEVKRHRALIREKRQEGASRVCAIVGYTNAGKSTLLNVATGASVLSEDKLFATLDPTTRAMTLPGGQEILLTDTVGFIRKLPHHLIEAFKSTLEEAKYADIILHVADASDERLREQMQVVYETLAALGVKDKPVITLFNKQDVADRSQSFADPKADYVLKGAVKYGEGLDDLKKVLEKILNEWEILIERLYDYKEAGKVGLIRRYGHVVCESYEDTGIRIKAYVPKEIYGKV